MLPALALGVLGFVMLRTAFAPEPDPRIVLAAIFGSGDGVTGRARRSRLPTASDGFEYDGSTDLPFTRWVDQRRAR